jgi:uncharacterized protein
MFLIKEIEFIDLNSYEVVMINLFNGAMDILEKDIYLKIVNNDFTNIDNEIIKAMKKRCYLFSNEDEYNNFINDIEKVIENNETKAAPNFLIIPGYDCNLSCIYCYEQTYLIERKTNIDFVEMINLQFEHIDKIIEDYTHKYGLDYEDIRITIVGGEPLLKHNFNAVAHIFESAQKRNYTIDIISNGVNLDEFINLFIQYKNTLKHIQITIDGIKEIHDARRIFRDKKGSFDIIMKNVALVLKNDINIVIRVNVDKTNIDGLPALADLLIENYGHNEHLSSYLYLLQDGGCSGEANIINENAGIEEIFRLEKKYPNMKNFKKKYHPEEFINCIFNDIPYRPKLKHCGASKNQYIFDCNSNIYKCWHGIGNDDFAIGKFYPEYTINQAKENSWLKRSVKYLEKCKECKYRYICGTGCPAAQHKGNANMNISEPSCVLYQELIKTIIIEKMKSVS